MRFTARIVTGAGRGKGLGTPTLNLDLNDIPKEMKEGIYACWVTCHGERRRTTTRSARVSPFVSAQGDTRFPAALHYGPRPVFNDNTACEVHLLDTTLTSPPKTATVTLVERIRDVRDFADAEALKTEIARDILRIREILKNRA